MGPIISGIRDDMIDNGYRVRLARFGDLDKELVASWEDLEERALETNAYLSPRFVLPAVRHLSPHQEMRETMFVFIEKTNGNKTSLVGAGVFVRSGGTSGFPLPHLRAYLSPHSYLSGLLVDREEAEKAIRAFFSFFCDRARTWHGVSFAHRLSKGPQAEWMSSVADEVGATWQEVERTQRAIYIPSEGGEKYIQQHLAHKHQKELRRQRRRLEEMGEVRWGALCGADVDSRSIDRFLEIEHMGWKATNGTSLRSNPSHELFFREVTDGFRKKGHIYFTELSSNDVVIASTSNFISGGAGFAFKIGWRPEYAKMSPGVLNEVECIRNAPEWLNKLSCIDSGAEEGSFIDQLWVRRTVLTSGIFGTTPVGKNTLSGIERMRRMKRWFTGTTPI